MIDFMKRDHLLGIRPKDIPFIRRLIQTSFLLFCLWIGYRFLLFFNWATGISDRFVPRPPAIEAFLPISALVGLRQFFLTFHYDTVHPAGLTILLANIFIAFFWRKGFCGWICPVGTISNIAETIGKKAGILLSLPAWIDIPLLGIKYILMLFFLYFIFFKMDAKEVQSFIISPYNIGADAEMLHFFLSPSYISLGVIILLITFSFFIRNLWCRYLCPYGALLGILALASPIQIRRDKEICTNCGRCDRICPSSIKITKRQTIRTVECIGCMECVSTCPVKGCLAPSFPPKKKAPLLLIPLGTIATLLLFWLVAKSSGHWHSHIPPEIYRRIYQILRL